MFRKYILRRRSTSLYIVVYFLYLINTSSASLESPVHNSSLDLIKYIKNDYDKTMIPNSSTGTPLDVKVDIYVTSIEPIDRKNMKFKLHIYLRHYWKDDNLSFILSNNSCTDHISLDSELIAKIWVPDTYIENEVKMDVRNRVLVLYTDGLVLLSERVIVEAYCLFGLRKYPMDVQECVLILESYSYAACQLRYSWFYEGRGESLRISKRVEMPNYVITELSTSTEYDDLKTGQFSRLQAKFQFTHKIIYALMRDYLPAAFIVITSWLSFYIDPAASPARVSLAVVTVLSISTQLSSTFSATPEVSYIKAIDSYLIGCFLFVFAAMIEYGFIHHYGEQTLKNRRTKMQQLNDARGVVNEAVEHAGTDTSGWDDCFDHIKEKHSKITRYRNDYSPTSCESQGNFHQTQSTSDGMTSTSGKSSFKTPCVDAVSRVAFPIFFLIFNVVYWLIYTTTI